MSDNTPIPVTDVTRITPPVNTTTPPTPVASNLPTLSRAFNGYRIEEVDRLLANMVDQHQADKRSLAQAYENQQRLAARIGSLQAQLDAAIQERDRLQHEAENPWETLGANAQKLMTDAKAQANDIRNKVREDAQRIQASASEQAKAALTNAQNQANKIIEQANQRIQQADQALQERTTQAEQKLATREQQLQQNIEQSKQDHANRIHVAEQREQQAEQAISQAKTMLQHLYESLDNQQ